MLRIRLQRRGKKGFATYRVVVAERGAPIKGKFVADLGSYNPHESRLEVNKEDVVMWIDRGAKPSDTLNNLFVKNGVIKGTKVRSWAPKKKKTEEEEGEVKEATDTAESEDKPKEEPKNEAESNQKEEKSEAEGS
jgi:small subunit ribosomal protein S16